MSRHQFEQQLRQRYLVREIRTGTFEEQRAGLVRPNDVPHGRDLTPAEWTPWDPGERSEVYEAVLRGFEWFAEEIGGTPPVTDVVFFKRNYVLSAAGHVTPDDSTGASYGAGVLEIFERVTESNPYPQGRSGPPAGSAATGGVRSALYPPRHPGERIARNVVHELGHALAEAMLQLDPRFIADYAQAVGWRGGELYDLVDPPVRITVDNWNDPSLTDQPISRYSLEGGLPSEDFAEAIQAFVAMPEVLRARSRRRFDFILKHAARWQRVLLPAEHPGDYPLPSSGQRSA